MSGERCRGISSHSAAPSGRSLDRETIGAEPCSAAGKRARGSASSVRGLLGVRGLRARMVEAADPMPSDPMPSGRWMASENPVPRHKPPTRASVLRDQSARHAHTYRALGAPGRLLAAGASAAAAARSAQPAAAAAALAVTHRRPNSAVTRAEQARSDKCWLGRRGAAGRGWAGGGGTSPSRRVRRPAEGACIPRLYPPPVRLLGLRVVPLAELLWRC